MNHPLDLLNERIVACERCPRLRAHCRKMAVEKRASYRNETYWGKPIPNFGDPEAHLLIVGLAPAAHGGNRTGRVFTGDRSGDWLFRAMHQAGFANQPNATHISDGLELHDAYITAACHCAPPDNKPLPDEIANCAPFFDETFAHLKNLKVVVALGKIGMDAILSYYLRKNWITKRAPYRFAHLAEFHFENAPTLLCSYHPSQQNTFTGKLTEQMLLDVFLRAKEIIQLDLKR